jgi:hypothetical protein
MKWLPRSRRRQASMASRATAGSTAVINRLNLEVLRRADCSESGKHGQRLELVQAYPIGGMAVSNGPLKTSRQHLVQ